MNENKKEAGIVQLTVTLFAVCAVCALILGLTNMITAPVIAHNQEVKKTQAITANVMPGYTGVLSQVNYVGSDATILSVLKGDDNSFVVEVAPKGSFSGNLTLMVGIDPNRAITGVYAVSTGETPGKGSLALEADYLQSQYNGKTGPLSLGGDVEAVSGATITSTAVCNAVNSAFEAIDNTNDAPFDPNLVPPSEQPGKGDDLVEIGGVIPGFDGEGTPVDYTGDDDTILSISRAGDMGYIVEVAPAGSFSGTLTVQVGIGADGKVTGIGILESGETPAYGGRASEPEWQAQFVGLSGNVALKEDGGTVDSIAGASTTSRAVCAGVTSALAAVASLG